MSMSMLDPEVLDELPDDLRNEILQFCKKRDVTSGPISKPETSNVALKSVSDLVTVISHNFFTLVVKTDYSWLNEQVAEKVVSQNY